MPKFLGGSKSQKYFKYGEVENTVTKYNISREGEVHTKKIDIPSPFKSAVRIDDVLEPSRYLFVEFEGIHDSYYIGINSIEFYDKNDEIVPYTNIAVDGQDVDNDAVQPAFPPNGWWAVGGEDHSLLFDFDAVTHVKEIKMWCANAASTPKYMSVTDGKVRSAKNEADLGFQTDLNLQLAGMAGTDPTKLKFFSSKEREASCQDIVNSLNESPPPNGFKNFLSTCGEYDFVFYREGLRTRVCNYYFGENPSSAVGLANSIQPSSGAAIIDVAKRAMTLEELRAVRAIIVSSCVKNQWKSSLDGKTRLTPSDVNLYDLNTILIKPLTKKRNCAFKELFPSGASTPTFYVSHWWGERVLDFIHCCEYHAMSHELSPSQAKYWVCAYANRQHDLGTDLGTDPAQSSFNRAMQKAEGVLLVIDPNVVVTSRIWVDYELYRTISTNNLMDMAAYNKGNVHLIAGKDLPNETAYQKNRREEKFPFAELAKSFLEVELYKGDASQEIDKIRILNVMRKKGGKLDDSSVLSRIKSKLFSDPQYIEDMEQFSQADSSLRAEMATKAVSVALSTEGQTLNNFHGFDLIDIIKADTLRKELIFDDLVSLDEVNDAEFKKLVGLIAPQVEKFILNVCGCRNITDSSINELELPPSLKELDLNMGYARNIEGKALHHLASVIPQQLTKLSLDVSGFKTPSGSYLPERYNDHLKEFASNMPPNLEAYSLVTTLASEDDDEGLVDLAKALPANLKEFSIVLESWEGFKGEFVTNMVMHLPRSLKRMSIKMYGGEYFNDEDFQSFSKEVSHLSDLDDFHLHTRNDGKEGYYRIRNIGSLAELSSNM